MPNVVLVILAVVVVAAAVVAIVLRPRPANHENEQSTPLHRGDAVEAVPDWASVLNPSQFKRFMQLVEAYFIERFGEFEFEDDWIVFHRQGDDGPSHLGLTNLAQICAHTAADEWGEQIAHHFGMVIEGLDEDRRTKERFKSFQEARPLLHVRIWPDDALQALQKDGLHDAVLARVDLPGTTTTLVYDLPHSIGTVERETADGWGLSDGELFEVALSNLRSLPGLPKAELLDTQHGAGLYAFSGDSFLTASIALILDDYPELMGDHGALVGVPTRHIVLVYPISDLGIVRAVNQMVPMIAGISHEGPGTISPNLYWYQRGTYVLLPYEIKDKAINFHPPDDFLEMLNRLPAE